MQAVGIDLCVNDPDTGLDTGRISGVTVDVGQETALELDLAILPESRFAPRWALADRIERRRGVQGPAVLARRVVKGGAVRLGRRTFPILRYRQWYGNWCWDAVWVDPGTAAEILNHLHATGKFQPTAGWQDLWRCWERGLFTAQDLGAAKAVA